MIRFSSKYRSEQEEIMDDFNLQGEELDLLLNDLRNVNTWLGGTSITIDGIKTLIAGRPKNKTITILDIGCGDGAMLRECLRFGEKEGYLFELIGLDANKNIIEEAKNRSVEGEGILYIHANVFSDAIDEIDFDICLCTLFLHHLSDPEIISVMNKLSAKAKAGLVINDLHRNRLAVVLFKIFGRLFLRTNIARHDGLVSIARGFKQKELEGFSRNIQNIESQIKWKWAFRYQWILKKIR